MTKSEWGRAAFILHDNPAEPARIVLHGRDRWALECLIAAGDRGCTPIAPPGPRWSAYVFKLREVGVQIEKRSEPHGGPFRGHHARYVLRSTVTRAPVADADRGAA
jgi:hypothetical protein